MKYTVLISSFLVRGQRWQLAALVALFFVAGCTVQFQIPQTQNLPDGGKVDVLPDTIPDEFAFGPRMYWSQIVGSDSTYSFAVTGANKTGRWLDSLRWVPSGPFVTINGDTLSTREYARDNSGITGDNQILTYNGSGSLAIEDGNTVDMSDLLDNTDDQTIDTFSLSGTTLSLSLEGDGEAAQTVDLSGYLDNTDAQTLSFSLPNLSISGGNSVDLSALERKDTLIQDSILVYYHGGIEIGRDTISGTGGGGGGADNLGNHIMTQNLQTNGNWISGDGDNEGLYVDGSGNIGIGENAPDYLLHLTKTGSNPWIKIERTDNAAITNFGIKLESVGISWDWYFDRSVLSDLNWDYNGATKMSLSRFGDLAITGGFQFVGDLNLSANYQIKSASNYIDVYDASTASMQFGLGHPTGGDFEFFNNAGTEIMTIARTGRIGINRASPSYVLDINSTDAVRLPAGTTAQNPTGANGLLRYNSDSTAFTGYYNAQWNRLVDRDYLAAKLSNTDYGSASGTTDASGDMTVSHTLGSASISVTATTTGTTFYHVQVHTKTTTSFKIRFFDAAGSPATSTAVTADWIAKLQ